MVCEELQMWDVYGVHVLIWVTCLFVKEKLWGACTDLPENFCTAFFQTGDHSEGIRFCATTISLLPGFRATRECFGANSGRPWMIDARTLHYSYCKLFIYHSTYTILQRTPTILLHQTNCTQQRNATYRLYSFGNIIFFHHIMCVSVLLIVQYLNYVLSGSIICVAQAPPGTNGLAKGRQRRHFCESV